MIRPGNSPPNRTEVSQVPTNGTARVVPCTIRRPVPDRLSSGRPYPLQPQTRTTRKAPTVSTQIPRRGRRKAAVKNAPASCSSNEAGSSRAAQWWACRRSRPPGTSKDSHSVDANARDIAVPRSRA